MTILQINVVWLSPRFHLFEKVSGVDFTGHKPSATTVNMLEGTCCIDPNQRVVHWLHPSLVQQWLPREGNVKFPLWWLSSNHFAITAWTCYHTKRLCITGNLCAFKHTSVNCCLQVLGIILSVALYTTKKREIKKDSFMAEYQYSNRLASEYSLENRSKYWNNANLAYLVNLAHQ